MNARMLRILTLAVTLVSAGEVLLMQWAGLAFRGRGLGGVQALAAFAALFAFNYWALRWSRLRLRSDGFTLLLSRVWIFGSIAALLTGLLLAAAFVVVGGGGRVLGLAPGNHAALAWVGGACVLFGFGSVLWGTSVGNLRVRVDRVDLPARAFPAAHREMRIAHITDLHIGPLLGPERLRDFVERVNRLEPDLIAITGDIFDFDPAFVEAGCAELGRLVARRKIYAVLGNHDVYTGADTVADGIARHSDIRLLRDEWDTLEIDGEPLAVAGLEDPGVGWTERESESPVLERLAREIPRDLPSLLLAHRPSYFAHAARLDFPVVLSGHTHGGQVALPLAIHFNPSRLIAHRTRGIFRDAGSTLYVSRGLGMAGLPLRLNCPREIALIRLAHPVG